MFPVNLYRSERRGTCVQPQSSCQAVGHLNTQTKVIQRKWITRMLVLLVINGALRNCCDALAALISDAASGSASRATRSSSRRAAGLEFISVLRGPGH